MPQFSFGLSKIEMGAKGANDAMGATLTQIGKTYEGTASFNVPVQEEKGFFSEENDAPELTIKKQGVANLEFTVMDCDSVTLTTLFGGTVTGTSPKVYEPPLVAANIELSVRATLSTGNILNIPRGVITATINAALSKNDLFQVKVMVKAFKPKSAMLAPWNMSFAT